MDTVRLMKITYGSIGKLIFLIDFIREKNIIDTVLVGLYNLVETKTE